MPAAQVPAVERRHGPRRIRTSASHAFCTRLCAYRDGSSRARVFPSCRWTGAEYVRVFAAAAVESGRLPFDDAMACRDSVVEGRYEVHRLVVRRTGTGASPRSFRVHADAAARFRSATTAMTDAGWSGSTTTRCRRPEHRDHSPGPRRGEVQLSNEPGAEIKERLGGWCVLDCGDLDISEMQLHSDGCRRLECRSVEVQAGDGDEASTKQGRQAGVARRVVARRGGSLKARAAACRWRRFACRRRARRAVEHWPHDGLQDLQNPSG